MLIRYDADEYETVSEFRTCRFHKANPNVPFAGCTCSGSVGRRKRSPEEIAEIKAARQREYEDRILAEAAIIRAARTASGDGQ